MTEFLRTNMHYPEEAHKADIQGRVIVTFVIEKDGSVTEAKVVRSVHPLLDEEAVRVVSAMPNWQPGKQDGKPVRVKYTIPIMFSLPKTTTPSPTVDIKSAELQALANPLVIMDGTVIDHEKLKTIDPQTIERMEVLKDQPAIEKYGEKAKNGVIIITTKK
jgi:TonB family protein